MAQTATTRATGTTPTNDLNAAKYAAIAKLIELEDGEKLREILALLGVEMPREEVHAEAQGYELTDEHKKELDRRYQLVKDGKTKMHSWESVRQGLKSQRSHEV